MSVPTTSTSWRSFGVKTLQMYEKKSKEENIIAEKSQNSVFRHIPSTHLQTSIWFRLLEKQAIKMKFRTEEVSENRLFASLWMTLVRGENINGFTKLGNSINYYVQHKHIAYDFNYGKQRITQQV